MDVDAISALIDLFSRSELEQMTVREQDSTLALTQSLDWGMATGQTGHSTAPLKTEAMSSAAHSEFVRASFPGFLETLLLAQDGILAKEGARLSEGDIVCLIRYGIHYRVVRANHDGTLGRQLVAHGAPIGFGQTLFEYHRTKDVQSDDS